jgi:3-oxoacyl-[acyl-carrier protein] reductase
MVHGAVNTAPRVALVTGGSRGIGRACCELLAGMGYAVAVNYRERSDAAADVVAGIVRDGGQAAAFAADVSDEKAVKGMVGAVEERWGPISVLINNAGIAPRVDVHEITAAQFDHVLANNLRSSYLVTQSVLPGMLQSGKLLPKRIIFMSSLAARDGGGISVAYAASKAGQEGLTHHYAKVLMKHGITVNAIAPALIATDIFPDASNLEVQALPLSRVGQPRDVAEVAAMLVRNPYITGQTLRVDAGRYMT